MMERRRALTLPFTVDKDSSTENPLKIPITCFSPECGKLEKQQVSWTAISGCRREQSDTQIKNGSMLFDHRHAARLEIARKKPCLILKDVLKTEQGRAYMKRIKQRRSLGNGGKVTSSGRESGQSKEAPLTCRETRSNQREDKTLTNNSVTPKCKQRTTTLLSPRQRLRRRLHIAGGEDDVEENKDIEEFTIGKDNELDNRFTEVVDCGLSVSWKPAENTRGCDESSPKKTKDRCTDAEKEVQHTLKRKSHDSKSAFQCNGTGSPKRHCESVLRLTGEDEGDEGATLVRVCLEESGEDGDLGNLGHSIVEFTVGGDDRTEVPFPVVHRQDSTIQTSTFEPIVLSSDDEESGDVPQLCSPAVHTVMTVEDTVKQGRASQEAETNKQEATDVHDVQVLRIVLDDRPGSKTLSPVFSADFTCIPLPFSTLYCGGYQGKANGKMMMANHKIIIPLKDASERMDVRLIFEREELRRYSVWEQKEMEAQQLFFNVDEDPSPAAFLLLYVSETAAAAIQRDLSKLYVNQDGPPDTGKASPFVLLSLKDPLEGVEWALWRSLLEIDNSMSSKPSTKNHGAQKVSRWEGVSTTPLTLDESIDVIRRSGLDSNLLSLLGLETTDPGLNTDNDAPHCDRDNTIAGIRLEIEQHKETVTEQETEPEEDTWTQLNLDEEHKEQELDCPSENEREEPTNLYTLCHRRTKGSYCVSLCKPDTNWTNYKHRGLAHRLIQFPPPPLKGGITVTMEDLQCLDQGQFLNDVIIDFYLKFLLRNASAAVAERSHIFSSFFYKQLTRRDNAREGTTSDSCQRQRRHQRVKTWTRHVDIFEKDFLFVPVNQEAHWYLVVICFPGLDEPRLENLICPDSQAAKCNSGTSEIQDQDVAQRSKNSNGVAEIRPTLNHTDNTDTETENAQEESAKDSSTSGPVNCTVLTCQKKVVCKRTCILIMDSLKLSLHERVFKLLREYLQSEWEVRRGSTRDFGPDQMKSSHCKVPLQDNSSDCGLYLLQYVESFLKDPVVHFDLPLHLERWFLRQKVRRKRDEIRDLILNLYRHQNLENNR